jgi:FtsZ-binding cell division protein ZapB
MTKILQSFNPYVFEIPEMKSADGTVLPSVTLPKAKYRPSEYYVNGPRKGFQARPIAELNDLEQRRIEECPQIQQMIATGVYRWLDHVPESMQTTEDMVSALKAENEALKSTKTPVDSEKEDLRRRITELETDNAILKAQTAPVVATTPESSTDLRTALEELSYDQLQERARVMGVKSTGKRALIIDAIMESTVTDETMDLEGLKDPEDIV